LAGPLQFSLVLQIFQKKKEGADEPLARLNLKQSLATNSGLRSAKTTSDFDPQ
jgi:hypothetical protein